MGKYGHHLILQNWELQVDCGLKMEMAMAQNRTTKTCQQSQLVQKIGMILSTNSAFFCVG